jgi:ferredoxin--NADP+ reductase
VGLIGHTKSDAKETIEHLLADVETGLAAAEIPDADAIVEHLEGRGVEYTTEAGWALLDAHELSLGEAAGRERIKVVPREEMVRVSRA